MTHTSPMRIITQNNKEWVLTLKMSVKETKTFICIELIYVGVGTSLHFTWAHQSQRFHDYTACNCVFCFERSTVFSACAFIITRWPEHPSLWILIIPLLKWFCLSLKNKRGKIITPTFLVFPLSSTQVFAELVLLFDLRLKYSDLNFLCLGSGKFSEFTSLTSV